MAKRTSKSKLRTHRHAIPVATPHLVVAQPTAPFWLRMILPVMVGICTFVSFMPALDAGFTNWDDDKVIVDNPHIRGLTSKHVGWMFSESKMGHYHPLTWVSYGVDHAIGQRRFDNLDKKAQARYDRGLDPKIFHLTNLLYHVAAVIAFYFLARLIFRITLRPQHDGPDWATPIAAAIAALFFGCHPLRVENAVWVTERRDVLSAMFLIPSLLCYLKYTLVDRWNGKKATLYVGSLLLLALSLLSKAWGITLPAVMLVMDVYPLRRLGGRAGWTGRRAITALVEKIPFILLAFTFATFARAAQADQRGTMKTLAEWGVDDRIAQFFYGLFWYSYKTLVPINLTPLVPLPPENDPFAARYVIGAIVVIVTAALLIKYRRKAPGLLVMAVCYAGVLSPILGIAQSGPQLVADKYAYLGCIPWAILAGGIWLWSNRKQDPSSATTLYASSGIAVVLLCVLGALTWTQSKKWENSFTLWSHAVHVEPNCATAQMNLGLLLKQQGHVRSAIAHYKASRKIDPNNPLVLTNLSLALQEQLPVDPQPSDFAPIIELQQQAVALQPKFPDQYFAMGNTLMKAGRLDEAKAAMAKCIQLRTDAGQIAPPKYHRALGTLYMQQREWDAASKQYEAALKLETNMDPKGLGVINALDRLGRIRAAQGRKKEAAAYFRQLLEIDPDNEAGQNWLKRLGESP